MKKYRNMKNAIVFVQNRNAKNLSSEDKGYS